MNAPRRFVEAHYRNYSDRASYHTVVEVGLYDDATEVEELLSRYATHCAGEPALVEEWADTDDTDAQWILADLSD